MNLKIILTGGGTAGHISPAISIAKKISEHYCNAELLYIGKEGGMEEVLVKREQINFEGIKISGLYRNATFENLIKNINTAINLIKSTKKVKKLLYNFKPDVIIATGGYVSAPVLYAGISLKIPTILHEQNVRPGLTTSLFKNKVNAMLLANRESENYFKRKKNIYVVGNPVKADFIHFNKFLARKELMITPEKTCIVSYGGSLGASKINEAVLHAILNFKNLDSIVWIHSTGKNNYNKFVNKLKLNGFDLSNNKKNFIVKEYIFNMPEYINAADIVVARAGALTISELQVTGKASVLVPSSNVANNHQYYNALLLAKAGAAIMVEDNAIDGNYLTNIINSLINNKEELFTLEQNIKNMAILDSSERICKIVYKIIGNVDG